MVLKIATFVPFLLNFMKFMFLRCDEVTVLTILIGGRLSDVGFFKSENYEEILAVNPFFFNST